MNKNEFINLLKQKLIENNYDDELIREIVEYYEDLILGYLENGLSEEETILKLGNIDEIIIKTNEEFSANTNIEFNELTSLPNISNRLGFKNQDLNLNGKNTIKLNTTSSSIVIEKSLDNRCYIKHTNSIFTKLNFYEMGNSIFIYEKSKRLKSYIYLMITNLILTAILTIILSKVFDFNWWKFLVCAAVCLTTFTWLVNLICLACRVDKIYLYIPTNKKLNFEVNGNFGSYKFKEVDINDLNVSIKSGNLKCKNINANNLYLKSTSGTIKLINTDLDRQSKANNIKAFASSGSIKIVDYICNDLTSRCRSGSIRLMKINSNSNIDTSVTSGSVSANEIKAVSLTTIAKSGSIRFKNININNINASVTSGSIVNKYVTTKNINATAKAGSIKILKINGQRPNYTLNLSSRLGRVKVLEIPNNNIHQIIDHEIIKTNNEFGTINAKVQTGDIKVTFLN